MNVQRNYQGIVFRSAKCRRPITFVTGLLQNHLIQLTLDRETDEIDQVDVTIAGPIDVVVRLVVAYRAGAGFVQIIGPAIPIDQPSPLRDAAAAEGFAFETIDPHDILAEPRLGGARAVWALRDRRVDAGMRVALQAALADDGPMRLDELCRRVPGPSDPVVAVAALACAGAILLDLSGGFGPATIVRSNA
jgi:hypothetical protein